MHVQNDSYEYVVVDVHSLPGAQLLRVDELPHLYPAGGNQVERSLGSEFEALRLRA